MSDRVSVTIADGVADVRLNRADKMNALDPAMFDGLVNAAHGLRDDPSVRAVVLSGEGRAFCAGLDFGSFRAMADSDRGEGGERIAMETPDDRITTHGQEAVYAWTALPVPVIAAVHGVAFGGGLQIALGADLRIVTPDVRMSVLEIRWGLVPDMTGTQILPALVGLDVAKELTFTGREVLGEEAARIGLATRVAEDPRAEAMELAGLIAAKSPQAIRGSKRLLDMAGRVSLAEGFAAEWDINRSLIGSPNQVEAVTAYFEQRDAVYADVED